MRPSAKGGGNVANEEAMIFVRLSKRLWEPTIGMRPIPTDEFSIEDRLQFESFLQIQASAVMPAARRLAQDEATEEAIAEGEGAILNVAERALYQGQNWLSSLAHIDLDEPRFLEGIAVKAVEASLSAVCPLYPIC
jgi:hypothetical protein